MNPSPSSEHTSKDKAHSLGSWDQVLVESYAPPSTPPELAERVRAAIARDTYPSIAHRRQMFEEQYRREIAQLNRDYLRRFVELVVIGSLIVSFSHFLAGVLRSEFASVALPDSALLTGIAVLCVAGALTGVLVHELITAAERTAPS